MKNSVPPNIHNFVLPQRRDLLGRKKYQRDAENRGQESAGPGEEQRGAAVLALRRRLRHGKLHQRSEHVDERNQLQHDGQRQQFLKQFPAPPAQKAAEIQ